MEQYVNRVEGGGQLETVCRPGTFAGWLQRGTGTAAQSKSCFTHHVDGRLRRGRRRCRRRRRGGGGAGGWGVGSDGACGRGGCGGRCRRGGGRCGWRGGRAARAQNTRISGGMRVYIFGQAADVRGLQCRKPPSVHRSCALALRMAQPRCMGACCTCECKAASARRRTEL